MLDVTGFIDRPLLFLFQWLKVVQLLIGYVAKASFKTIIKKSFLPPRSNLLLCFIANTNFAHELIKVL